MKKFQCFLMLITIWPLLFFKKFQLKLIIFILLVSDYKIIFCSLKEFFIISQFANSLEIFVNIIDNYEKKWFYEDEVYTLGVSRTLSF